MITPHAAADGMKHLNIGFGKDFPAIHTWHKSPFRMSPEQYKHGKIVVKVHGTAMWEAGWFLLKCAALHAGLCGGVRGLHCRIAVANRRRHVRNGGECCRSWRAACFLMNPDAPLNSPGGLARRVLS
jgi:hypothetical protein